MSLRFAILTCLASAVLASPVNGQQPAPAAMDSLLQRLVGSWQMTGSVRGRAATYRMTGARVLRNRFVELHMQDTTQPPAYEARVFIGVDSSAARYIVHWLDAFGAAFSIPHGVGGARGDTVQFTFAYASGPFRDTFVYDRRRNAWYLRLESADSTGRWNLFAEYHVTRR